MMTTSGGTPPSFPYHHHLHGLGNGGGEKRSQFLSNHQPPYQHRHQRQNSTSSSVSFNGTGVGFGNTNGGNTAAAIAASVARSQAYAQLTGTATVVGLGLGMGVPGGNANVTSASSKRRRPSTSPGSTTGSGSETSSIHSQLSPYGRRFAQSQRLGSEPGSETLVGNRSANTLMPLSSSAPSSTSRPTPSSSVSLSHYGNSVVTRSPRSPHHAPLHHLTSSLPKSKSILTRTSSMSTKNSGCGGTVKSVKFVEIPEVHYRSGCYDQDGNEYVYGYDGGGPSGSDDADGGDGSRDEDQDMDEDDNLAVGAKGEGQEGMVLRECMGLDIEAIDMDIDTYLGVGKAVEAEEGGEKESKLSFKRMPGLGWGFLSKSKKAEKENRREEDESKDSIVPPTEVEQKKEEKDKSSSGFGLKRLMGFTARKTPPPPLSLSISSPFSLGPKSPTTVAASQTERSTEQRKTKQSTSPPVSPRKPISGPYALGSRLPSRSPPTHSSLPSPSSSFIQQPISSRFNPASSSNTSLNRTNQGRQFSMNNHGNATHRSRSIRSTHRTNPSLTTVTNLGMNTERPVGPNIAGTRPKGFVGNDEVLSLNAVPLKNATSCESFRSARSYGGRSVRSEVGSMKSAKSVGGGSTRSFRTWMNRNGVGQGYSGTNVAVAVAE
ncbi:hypothetical protein AN958_08494 [Leucoagaricus sp. SymC.cos]|nr:hypothetical protein AN958_08494 [Leucoagaricus sp. SymC.cos]